jgi:hypothetical protein
MAPTVWISKENSTTGGKTHCAGLAKVENRFQTANNAVSPVPISARNVAFLSVISPLYTMARSIQSALLTTVTFRCIFRVEARKTQLERRRPVGPGTTERGRLDNPPFSTEGGESLSTVIGSLGSRTSGFALDICTRRVRRAMRILMASTRDPK